MARAVWSKVFQEYTQLGQQAARDPIPPGQPNPQDNYRRAKIASVESLTKRPLVVYASACTSPGKSGLAELLMLDFSDKIGLKAVTDSIDGPNLDVLVHSPGGYPDAAESIVQQLRGRYTSIRFIVPSFAKSAATMLVMSGDQILMDRDAELGPIDPQMRTQSGVSPAVAVIEQFKKIQDEVRKDPSRLSAWMPILAQLGPSLLVDCEHAIELAKNLVRNWVRDYMLRGDPEGPAKSARVAEFLSDHGAFKSHARPVKASDLKPLGVKIEDLLEKDALGRAVSELYCCLDIMFSNTPVCKLFENSAGDAVIRNSGIVPQPFIMQVPGPRPGGR